MSDNPLLPAQRSNDRIGGRRGRMLDRQQHDLEATTSLELDRVRAVEAIEVARLEALETAGHVGIAAVGRLARHRRFEIEDEPSSLGCVDHICEVTTRAIGSRIETMGRRLG
jgi:hypothetical protein